MQIESSSRAKAVQTNTKFAEQSHLTKTKEQNDQCTSMNAAPFNCSASKIKEPKNNYPGPGSYDIDIHKEVFVRKGKERVLVPSNELNSFKSKCKRFLDSSNCIPGPGNYNISKDYKQKHLIKRGSNKMIDFFRNEKLKHKLIPETPAFVQVKQKIVSKTKSRPKVAFNTRSNRSLFNCRPQSAVMEYTRDKPQQQQPKHPTFKPRLASAIIVKQNRFSCPVQTCLLSQQLRKSDNSQWLGPGYYHSEYQQFGFIKNPLSGGEFGSTVKRFSSEQTTNENPVFYKSNKSQERISTASSYSRAFMNKENRFKDTDIQSIGPGQYDLKNDFEHLLQSNMKKGAKNVYGKTSKRFFQSHDMSPGPGDYNLLASETTIPIPNQRLKSACSLKNLKQKQKELLKKYYMKHENQYRNWNYNSYALSTYVSTQSKGELKEYSECKMKTDQTS